LNFILKLVDVYSLIKFSIKKKAQIFTIFFEKLNIIKKWNPKRLIAKQTLSI